MPDPVPAPGSEPAPEPAKSADPAPAPSTEPAKEPASEPLIESVKEPATDPKTSLMEDPAQGKDPADIPANWPDNWRDLLVGEKGDDKLANRLKRFKSPEGILKSYLDLEKKVSQGLKPTTIDDKSTPEEIAAYRKEIGVPEKPEDYKLEFSSDELKNDTNKEELTRFQEFAHEHNLPPAVAQDVLGWYEESIEVADQQRIENVYKNREETKETLAAEWGSEYKGNMSAISQYLDNKLGEDAKAALIKKQFADGTFLGDNLHFMKMMAEPATDFVGPDGIFSGDVEQVAKDVDKEIEENMKLLKGSRDDIEKYRSEKFQTDVMQPLFKKKKRLEERRGR